MLHPPSRRYPLYHRYAKFPEAQFLSLALHPIQIISADGRFRAARGGAASYKRAVRVFPARQQRVLLLLYIHIGGEREEEREERGEVGAIRGNQGLFPMQLSGPVLDGNRCV